MNGLFVALLFVVGAVVFSFILYMIIKAAVRDGIIEARLNPITDQQDTITKIICPNCGKKHEMDYPKCPHCGHVNFSL